MVKRLSLKQRNFVHEYVANGGNATKAALQAYDTNSPTTAQVIGSQNLSKLMVSEYIEQLLANRDGLRLEDALNALSEVVNAPTPPLASHSEKLAGTKLLLQLHKAITSTQPTLHVSTHLDAKAIAAQVAAQEIEAEEVIDTEDE